jgi:hypothetical protein
VTKYITTISDKKVSAKAKGWPWICMLRKSMSATRAIDQCHKGTINIPRIFH